MCMPNTESVYIIYITIRWPYIILAEMHRYWPFNAGYRHVYTTSINYKYMYVHVTYVYMQLQGGHIDISVDITN